MQKHVEKFVLNCDLCQRVKYFTIAMEGPYNQVISHSPSDLVTVDYYGPLPCARGGVEYVFVVLDAFSKLIRLYPLKKATTLQKWRESLENLGIKVLCSSVRHPQSNPTERVMRELGRLFRTYCEDKHTAWANQITTIENLLNITTHFSTNYAANEIHFGKPIQDDIQKIIKFPIEQKIDHKLIVTLARENIKKNFSRRLKNQKVVSKVKLAVNDLVMMRVRHLSNALDKVFSPFRRTL